MSDHSECEKTCQQPCDETCPPDCAGPSSDGLTLAQILERFEREAVRGAVGGGRTVPYWAWGEGPPLLLLHGLADDGRTFIPMAALLARAFRCVAVELTAAVSMGGLVADVGAVLDHLGHRQSYLYGTSFGAAVGLAALHAEPQRIPRAVLHAPILAGRLTLRERFLFRVMSHWPGSVGRLPFRRRLTARRHRGPFDGVPSEVWDYFLAATGEVPARAVGRRVRLANRSDLRPLLSSIRQPILVLEGDRDPASGGEALAALPAAARAVIEGAGHYPQLSHPEAVAGLVRRFLTPPRPEDRRIPLADCQVG